MCDSSSEMDTKTIQRARKGSSSTKDDSNVGNSSGGSHLKKGPWTSTEDAILVEYVTSQGEGNWNAVQKYSGLSRCGKSCRLRWANHLRPDLKKGAFSPDEEKRIIELHAKMGNKWARMAVELPGRTDNEIKNFWNTRIKRLQRANLPIYPLEIHARSICESQQCQDLSSAGLNHSKTSDISHFRIPAFDIKKVGLTQGYFNSSSSLLSLPDHNILFKDTSSSLDVLFPMHPHKRPRESETTFPNFIGLRSMCDGFSSFAQDNTPYGKYNGHSSRSPSFGVDLNINNINPSPIDTLCESHALNSGNSCSSESISVAMMLELPSIQHSTSQVGTWEHSSSPLPSLESVDIIQSPLSDQTQSNCPSPRTSGLLDTIVYESHMKKLKTNSFPSILESPIGDDFLESSKWDVSGDSVSPLNQSTTSVLIEYTPLSRSSLDEPKSTEIMQGLKGNAETSNSVSVDSHGGIRDFPSRFEDLRPDMLLDSCWLGFPRVAKDEYIAGDIGTHFDDDQNFDEYVQQICSLSAESNQSNILGSSPWENTTDMCRLSDHL